MILKDKVYEDFNTVAYRKKYWFCDERNRTKFISREG